MKNVIWGELRFFLERLEALSVSQSIVLGSGFCVSVASYAENWVYLPEPVDAYDYVVEATMFFDELGETFMWPLYEGSGEILEREGVPHVGDITAMSLDPKDADDSRANESVTCAPVSSLEDAMLWARTAWRSFGGDDDVPKEYRAFISALHNEGKDVSLHLARLDGEAAGVFLITNAPEVTGVYYFGTLPEMRRKGVASSMMKEIYRLSGGKKIVLQSSPAGVEFYRSFGFTEHFRIPVYSTDREIL